MRLNASSFYGLYRPSFCPLRVFLRATGFKEGEPHSHQNLRPPRVTSLRAITVKGPTGVIIAGDMLNAFPRIHRHSTRCLVNFPSAR